jgi:hypothetical protein
MPLFKPEIVTNHFVEMASINRRSRKVTRYHDRGTQRALLPCNTPHRHHGIAPSAFRRQHSGIRLIRRNETMRRIEGEKIAGHIGRNSFVRTSGAHFAREIGLVRDCT